jgi:hypothetical protein
MLFFLSVTVITTTLNTALVAELLPRRRNCSKSLAACYPLARGIQDTTTRLSPLPSPFHFTLAFVFHSRLCISPSPLHFTLASALHLRGSMRKV